MPHTRADRLTLPDDPEEIRALFRRRMRERDKVHNPHVTPDEDTSPKEDRAAKVPQSTPSKLARRNTKPYRVIYLTEEEVRAMDEGRLTAEEIKYRDTRRDDDIPKAQRSAKPRSRQETGHEANTGQVHARGPDKAPTGTGDTGETEEDHEKSARVHRENSETGRVHVTDRDSRVERRHEHGAGPRNRTRPDDDWNRRSQRDGPGPYLFRHEYRPRGGPR